MWQTGQGTEAAGSLWDGPSGLPETPGLEPQTDARAGTWRPVLAPDSFWRSQQGGGPHRGAPSESEAACGLWSCTRVRARGGVRVSGLGRSRGTTHPHVRGGTGALPGRPGGLFPPPPRWPPLPLLEDGDVGPAWLWAATVGTEVPTRGGHGAKRAVQLALPTFVKTKNPLFWVRKAAVTCASCTRGAGRGSKGSPACLVSSRTEPHAKPVPARLLPGTGAGQARRLRVAGGRGKRGPDLAGRRGSPPRPDFVSIPLPSWRPLLVLRSALRLGLAAAFSHPQPSWVPRVCCTFLSKLSETSLLCHSAIF